MRDRTFGNRRKFIQYSALTLVSSLMVACRDRASETSPSLDGTQTLDQVRFGTNWYAQAEHGGFYQAIAKGIYQEHGLDVTIQMGGAQVNVTQILVSGAVDFAMGGGASAIQAVAEGIPKITVAAIFQKDPQILLAHPESGAKTLEDLKGKPIYVSAGANQTFWPFLRAKYGFTDDQKRPYNFTIAPFLNDKNSAQQGYVSSEPLKVEKEGGFKPLVFLLADYGYTPYATTIETRRELVEKNPDLVQRFVDASIKGWYSYLEDPAPGNELIKKDNPEMTDELLAYSLETLKKYGVILSGEAETKGIGAMVEQRWKDLFDEMVEAKIIEANVDYTQAFTLQFINKLPK